MHLPTRVPDSECVRGLGRGRDLSDPCFRCKVIIDILTSKHPLQHTHRYIKNDPVLVPSRAGGGLFTDVGTCIYAVNDSGLRRCG